MSLDHLWAGWRSEYVASIAGGGPGVPEAAPADPDPLAEPDCVFCAIIADAASDEERRVLEMSERSVAVLNAYPYASGHVLVLPRRHLAALADLDEAESQDLWSMAMAATRAIEAAYGPDGMNLGANLGRAAGAGIPSHLHLHVVPRWIGDTNFMTAVASVRVLPEALGESWAKLRAGWPR